MSAQWVTIFDVDKCTGCCNCVLATLDEHVGNDQPGYSAGTPLHGQNLLDVEYWEQGSYPLVDIGYFLKACQHCAEPACAKAASDAVYKRPDGIVMIDPSKAIGRREIVDACPFGAIAWNAEANIPQIWTMDAHLLDSGWGESRASQACPTGALLTRKLAPAEVICLSQEANVQQLGSVTACGGNVFYRNLGRMGHRFLTGCVIGSDGEFVVAVSGAMVALNDDQGEVLSRSVTDAYGDFKLDVPDGIDEGERVIVITSPDGRQLKLAHAFVESRHLGTFRLD